MTWSTRAIAVLGVLGALVLAWGPGTLAQEGESSAGGGGGVSVGAAGVGTEPGGPEEGDGVVASEVIFGTVIRIRDLGTGPSLYSDFETGGIEALIETEDGVRRVLFGPQWTYDVDTNTYHIGMINQGQELVVIGFTIPFRAEEDPDLDSAPDERPAPPPLVAEEVHVDGRTIRPAPASATPGGSQGAAGGVPEPPPEAAPGRAGIEGGP